MEEVAAQPKIKDPKQGRRYDLGVFELYDRHYQQIINKEWPSKPERVIELIEGSEEQPTGNGKTARMVDLKDGSNSGYTTNSKKAKLEALKPQFEDLEARHEFQSYQIVRNGESLSPDTSWTGDLLEELLTLQAQRDAFKEVARQAREKIELQKEKAKQEKQENILKYGLSGKPILGPHKGHETDFKGHPNAKPVEVDGQHISLHPDSHIPYLDEGPYEGMILMDYREMAEQWRKDNALDEQSIEELNEKRLADGKPKTNYRSLYKSKGVDEDSFPEWPSSARKIDEL